MSTINSPQNKGLLWNVLLENGSFAGIPETKIGEVSAMLDEVVEEVVGGANGLSTMGSNKRVLEEMSRRLRTYRATTTTTTTTAIPTPTPTPTTTREDIQKQRIDRMNDMAKKMSVDMARYEPKKPKTVRFSDDVDKLSPEILESRLEQAIAARNLDMMVTDVSGGAGAKSVDGAGGDDPDTVLPIEPDVPSYVEVKRMYDEMKEMYGEMKAMISKLQK
jgi:hypothetical protein